jgi:hypothetical protein
MQSTMSEFEDKDIIDAETDKFWEEYYQHGNCAMCDTAINKPDTQICNECDQLIF